MATLLDRRSTRTKALTIADLADRFGPMPPWRIRFEPAPGTATERDLLHVLEHEGRLCELVDGTLVEKDVGCEESELTLFLAQLLGSFVRPRKLGRLTGPDGPMRLKIGIVRLPDIAFVARRRFPGGRKPQGAIQRVAPNLAVEVLSRSNTPQEMNRKLEEYFRAGVELVWYIDPRSRTVEVYTSPEDCNVLKENQTLTGGKVLPGFRVKLRDLFGVLDE